MGAAATTALATAVVPYGLDAKVEADLHHMMAGAVAALSEAGCRLVGGHTCEGAEMALGACRALTCFSLCQTALEGPSALCDESSPERSSFCVAAQDWLLSVCRLQRQWRG